MSGNLTITSRRLRRLRWWWADHELPGFVWRPFCWVSDHDLTWNNRRTYCTICGWLAKGPP